MLAARSGHDVHELRVPYDFTGWMLIELTTRSGDAIASVSVDVDVGGEASK